MRYVGLAVDEVVPLAEFHKVAKSKTDEGTDSYTQNDLIDPQKQKPIFNRSARILIQNQVERNIEKWKRSAVIATRFSCEEVADMRRYVFVGIFPAYDCCCEDWVCRGETSSDCECGEKVEAWDEGVDEAC